LEMDVQRADQKLHVSLPVHIPDKAEGDLLVDQGMVPSEPSIVRTVEAGDPAKTAGLEPGDAILSVNGISVRNAWLPGFFDVLQRGKDQPAKISLLRDGREMELTVTPKWMPSGEEPPAWRIGVSLRLDYHIEQLRFPAALRTAAVDCKKNSTLIFKLLKD